VHNQVAVAFTLPELTLDKTQSAPLNAAGAPVRPTASTSSAPSSPVDQNWNPDGRS
jgi:hypothetical protein